MRNTDAFDPTVRAMNFSIPTIRGIVSHFIGFVLSEPQPFRIDSNLGKEVEGFGHEKSDRLMANDALFDSFSERHFEFTLLVCNQRYDMVIPNGEIMLSSFVRVDEIFQLSHVKFTQAYHALPRGNFVTVALSNLHSSKG